MDVRTCGRVDVWAARCAPALDLFRNTAKLWCRPRGRVCFFSWLRTQLCKTWIVVKPTTQGHGFVEGLASTKHSELETHHSWLQIQLYINGQLSIAMLKYRRFIKKKLKRSHKMWFLGFCHSGNSLLLDRFFTWKITDRWEQKCVKSSNRPLMSHCHLIICYNIFSNHSDMDVIIS